MAIAARTWSRLRVLGQNLRWQALDRADRLLLRQGLERLAVRRLSGTAPAGRDGPVTRLYVDISVIHKHDAGTGIQRVVRSIREHLPHVLGAGTTLEPVIVQRLRDGYVTLDGAPLRGGPGALFFGLDFATDAVFRTRVELRTFREAGGRVWFLVHDALPLTHPQWFTHASCLKYRRWLRVCAALADGILCVSPVVAAQLAELLPWRFGRASLPPIVTIELGANITPADRRIELAALPATPGLDTAIFNQAALVVGTLEPRKGHADVLAAFDRLWAQGCRAPLVLIGRAGWNTAALQARIRQHPRHGELLFWLDDVDDHALHAAYRYCRLVIVPSLAEGYGLPLDEALALGAPVLARDIPVFRRHGDEPVSYFPQAADPDTIAAAILTAHATAEGPRRFSPLREWDETARQVVSALGCSQS